MSRFTSVRRRRKEEIDHPNHYGGDTVYEAIKVIEAWGLGVGFTLGNAVKYICRAGDKESESELKDLKKARWYLDRRIAQLEREDERHKTFVDKVRGDRRGLRSDGGHDRRSQHKAS